MIRVRNVPSTLLRNLFPACLTRPVMRRLQARLELSYETFKLEQALRDYGFSHWRIAEIHSEANRMSKRQFISFLEAYKMVATTAIQTRLKDELDKDK